MYDDQKQFWAPLSGSQNDPNITGRRLFERCAICEVLVWGKSLQINEKNIFYCKKDDFSREKIFFSHFDGLQLLLKKV